MSLHIVGEYIECECMIESVCWGWFLTSELLLKMCLERRVRYIVIDEFGMLYSCD